MADFNKILNSIGCALLVFDKTMRVEHANSQAGMIFRVPPRFFLGKPAQEIDGFFVGQDAPLSHCIEKGERIIAQEREVRRADGSRVFISMNACPLFDSNGTLEGLAADFTERPRREERLHQFIGAMDEVVFEFDSEGRYLNVWSENEDLLKMPPRELLGKRVEEVVPEELAAKLKSALQQVGATGQPETIEYALDVMGGQRWFLARIAMVSPPEGEEPTFSFLARDVTKMKELEQSLQDSERKFHGIFDRSFQFFGLLKPDGTLIEINNTACEFLDVEKSDVLGLPFWETPWWAHAPERQEELRAAIRRAAQGESVRFETRHFGPDGKEHVIDVSLKPILENGNVVLLIPEGRDVTERKLAEEELQAANRDLEAFVHTVSHDLRTPLTAILGFTQLFSETYGEDLNEKGREMLATIEKNSLRMAHLLEDLLALARVGNLERPDAAVDVNLLVQDVLANLSELISETGVAVKVQQLPFAHVPATLLTQVFDNLIGNAVRYAGKAGGPVEIGGQRQGERVLYFVRDHGPGIPPGERSRIFDLFYRGVFDEKVPGTGVGLAIVQKIARLYGGEAWVEDTPGGGATFRVALAEAAP